MSGSIRYPNVVPRANLQGAHLENAVLSRRNITEAHLERAHLERADLQFAILNKAHLEGAHLRQADLTKANLEEAHLEGADLKYARLNRANLEGAHLEGAVLRGADLTDANLGGAHLEGADLTDAILTRTEFTRADLARAILSDRQREQITANLARVQQMRNEELRRIALIREQSSLMSSIVREYLQHQPLYSMPMHHQPSISASANQLASASPSVSASAFAGHSALTISRDDFGSVINIPLVLRLGTKNSASNSCPNYKPLYDQLMLVNLDGGFRFHFEGESGRGQGLTKIVYSFLLPVYTKLYFVEGPEFIILKKDANIEELKRDTLQLIKLAKAAQSQIYLQIDPRLLELLLQQNPAESIIRNKNFNRLYANLKARVSEIIKSGEKMSNYLPNNTSNQSISSPEHINNLSREVKSEIILRKRLYDFGFETWGQYENMATFIKTFWITSNRRRNVEHPLFSCEIKYDIESFMKRLQIKREDTQQVLNLQEAQSLYGVYPALSPLLKYVLDRSENGNENRRKLVRYVAGTEYTLCEIKISLQTVDIPFDNSSNRSKLYRLPFFPRTCFSTLDLFKTPRSGNYQEVWTVARINEEITKGSGLAAHN
jgi:uncharacterized protein YjbI with pentapeptide repeats